MSICHYFLTLNYVCVSYADARVLSIFYTSFRWGDVRFCFMPEPDSLETSGKYANRVLIYVLKRMLTVLPSCEKSKCNPGSDDVKMHPALNRLHFMRGPVILIQSGKYINLCLILMFQSSRSVIQCGERLLESFPYSTPASDDVTTDSASCLCRLH